MFIGPIPSNGSPSTPESVNFGNVFTQLMPSNGNMRHNMLQIICQAFVFEKFENVYCGIHVKMELLAKSGFARNCQCQKRLPNLVHMCQVISKTALLRIYLFGGVNKNDILPLYFTTEMGKVISA
jgi:hypothetical protein